MKSVRVLLSVFSVVLVLFSTTKLSGFQHHKYKRFHLSAPFYALMQRSLKINEEFTIKDLDVEMEKLISSSSQDEISAISSIVEANGGVLRQLKIDPQAISNDNLPCLLVLYENGINSNSRSLALVEHVYPDRIDTIEFRSGGKKISYTIGKLSLLSRGELYIIQNRGATSSRLYFYLPASVLLVAFLYALFGNQTKRLAVAMLLVIAPCAAVTGCNRNPSWKSNSHPRIFEMVNDSLVIEIGEIEDIGVLTSRSVAFQIRANPNERVYFEGIASSCGCIKLNSTDLGKWIEPGQVIEISGTVEPHGQVGPKFKNVTFFGKTKSVQREQLEVGFRYSVISQPVLQTKSVEISRYEDEQIGRGSIHLSYLRKESDPQLEIDNTKSKFADLKTEVIVKSEKKHLKEGVIIEDRMEIALQSQVDVNPKLLHLTFANSPKTFLVPISYVVLKNIEHPDRVFAGVVAQGKSQAKQINFFSTREFPLEFGEVSASSPALSITAPSIGKDKKKAILKFEISTGGASPGRYESTLNVNVNENEIIIPVSWIVSE